MVKAYFDNIRQQLLAELDKANEKIIVAVYWFTNETLFQKLIDKLNEGLKVELIVHNDYVNNRETGLPFQKFIRENGDFYFSSTLNPMHNKFCIIDDKTLINGSYNWAYYAESKNRENILLIKDEQETIDAFIKEFEQLKSLTERIESIQLLTPFEIDEFNQLRASDYLANDIIYQAKETGKRDIIETAFQIAPNNIDVQKVACNLNLTKKRRLKHSIGSSLKDDKYLIIIPKGTIIPVSKTEIVQTSKDKQTIVTSTILYGEDLKASKNSKIDEMTITEIPPKPVGQAKLKYHFTIDVYGSLKMEKFSLDTGKRQVIRKKIMPLLEEVIE